MTPRSSGDSSCDLAAQGDASVALLRVNGETISAQVLMYCGATAYTWKTAFDSGFARYSPGALLIDRMPRSFLPGRESWRSIPVPRKQLHGPAMGRAPAIWSICSSSRSGKIARLPNRGRPAARLSTSAGLADGFRDRPLPPRSKPGITAASLTLVPCRRAASADRAHLPKSAGQTVRGSFPLRNGWDGGFAGGMNPQSSEEGTILVLTRVK